MTPGSTRRSARLHRTPTMEEPDPVVPSATTGLAILRKNTMEQTIEASKEWLEPTLGKKRKRTETDRLEPPAPKKAKRSPKSPKHLQKVTTKPTKPKNKRQSKSKSPARPARKPRKQLAGRSLSPTPAAAPPEAACSWSGDVRDAVPSWVFHSGAPAFGLHVERQSGKVWMGNDDGAVFGLLATGEVETHMQLDSGVKCLASDLGQSLYAGCDNGAVYDVTHQRLAYEIDADVTAAPSKERMSRQQQQREKAAQHLAQGSGVPKAVRRRHVVLCVDVSSSMRGQRISAAVQNIRMLVSHNLAPTDKVSLVTFDSNSAVRFSNLHLASSDDAKRIEKEVELLPSHVAGTTALYSALLDAYDVLDEGDVEEEQWVVAVTDGSDNASKVSAFQVETRAGQHHAGLLCVCLDTKPTPVLRDIVAASPAGLLLASSVSSSMGPNMAQTFREISQVLSSGVLGLAVRDGMLVVGDNKGQLAGRHLVRGRGQGSDAWRRGCETVDGTSGWMLCSSALGLFHGHSEGVSRVTAESGDSAWKVQLPAPVLSGCVVGDVLHVAAGSSSYVLRCSDGSQVCHVSHGVELSCNAADGGVEYVGGKCGMLQAVDTRQTPPKVLWRCSLPAAHGFALSMQHKDDRLFVSTSSGSLLCLDSSSPMQMVLTKEVRACPPPTGIRDLASTSDATAGTLVTCHHVLSDASMRQIAAAVHACAAGHEGIVQDVRYAIEEEGGRKQARVEAHNLLFVQQDAGSNSTYGQMARSGRRVTWCTNSYGGGRWGLVVDDEVLVNGSPVVVIPEAGQRDAGGQELEELPVLFPHDLRKPGMRFLAPSLALGLSGDYYRVEGQIRIYAPEAAQ